jgi:D-sedoheptulose 7-phosphate isomerase
LIAGNGGSAADAQHFAGEIVGRFKKERKGYPAIALTTDASIITSWANDYDFNTIFSRQIEALGKEGDVFLGISTSGNSKNIIEAVKKAKEMGIFCICLLGKDGGELKNLTDLSIIIPSDNTPRIQECHIMIIHIICEELEKSFLI